MCLSLQSTCAQQLESTVLDILLNVQQVSLVLEWAICLSILQVVMLQALELHLPIGPLSLLYLTTLGLLEPESQGTLNQPSY